MNRHGAIIPNCAVQKPELVSGKNDTLSLTIGDLAKTENDVRIQSGTHRASSRILHRVRSAPQCQVMKIHRVTARNVGDPVLMIPIEISRLRPVADQRQILLDKQGFSQKVMAARDPDRSSRHYRVKRRIRCDEGVLSKHQPRHRSLGLALPRHPSPGLNPVSPTSSSIQKSSASATYTSFGDAGRITS